MIETGTQDEGLAPGRLYYGWVVLGTSFVMVTVATGMLLSFGVFLKPLEEALGWSRTALSGAVLLNWTLYGVSAFVFGWLSDRVGTRLVTLGGGLLYGASLLATSQSERLWHYYLAFGVASGIGNAAFYVPLTSTATRWFQRGRGFAVAVISCGNGAGILVMAPLVRWLISAYGWRTSYALLGLLAWAALLPGSLLLRDSPPQIGLSLRGASAGPGPEPGSEPARVRGPARARDLWRCRSFWVLALMHFFCCSSHSGPLIHLAAYGTDLGLSKSAAAAALGLSGATSVGGRIGTGLLADRIGSLRTLIGTLVAQTGAILAYSVMRGSLVAFDLVSAGFGIAYGGVMPLYALLARETFGQRTMGAAYGGVFFISTLGMGLGSYLGGLLFDIRGSYALLYPASALMGVAALGLALMHRRSQSKP